MTRTRQAGMSDRRRVAGWGLWTGLWASVVAVAGACAGGGDAAVTEGREQAMLLDARDVAVAELGVVSERVALSGDLQPFRTVLLSAQVPGTVQELAADRGTRVRAGQMLAVLEADGIREQAAGADAAVAAAEAGLALARQQLESAELLHGAGALSDLDLEGARTGLEAARAQLAGARAQAASAREAARRATVVSPIDGQVAARTAEIGETVNPGQPLFTVVDLRYLELRAQIPVGSATRVRPGMPVVFELDAYPGRSFTGTLDRMEPTADPDTRKVAVYARLPNPDRTMLGGLFARGWVVVGDEREVLTIPEEGLRDGVVGPHVLLVKGGRIRTRPVTAGVRDPGRRVVEIRQGLEPGDTVLVVPGTAAAEGVPVEVAPAPAPMTADEG